MPPPGLMKKRDSTLIDRMVDTDTSHALAIDDGMAAINKKTAAGAMESNDLLT